LATNPHGRGMVEGPDGNTWLPNIELKDAPITGRDQRPTPAGAFPMGMGWKSRQALLGTYDERWRKTRFPWLAEDFRFAFFNEAPEDQRVNGFWRGDESIQLSNLHPSVPKVRTRLPGLRARAFIERESADETQPGAFEEVPLVLDTITIDADRGVALCVWRGLVDLGHDALAPDGVARLFVMDEPADERSSVEACRERMLAKLEADAASDEELEGEEPPADEDMQTIAAPPTGELQAVLAAAGAYEPEGPDPGELFEKIKADLRAAGLDPDAATADAASHVPQGPMVPPDVEEVRAAFAKMGQDLPEEIETTLEALDEAIRNPPEPYELPEARPPVDLRQQVIDLHRARRPLVGDFSGANLSQLSLPGLSAAGAILINADFRGTNLEQARFDGANLGGAELFLASLAGASFVKADLTKALIEAADFSGANLDGATLEGAEAVEVKLDRATMRKTDLTGALLEDATLVGAICDEAVFTGAKLTRARCNNASFVDARLYSIQGGGLVFDRADLSRVRVGRGADLTGASFKGAKAKDSRWRDSVLKDADFSGAMLDGADFSHADLSTAMLASCTLKGAVFQGASVIETKLSKANLFEGSFREADLSRADLRGANLYSVDFFMAKADGVLLSGANLRGTTWDRS